MFEQLMSVIPCGDIEDTITDEFILNLKFKHKGEEVEREAAYYLMSSSSCLEYQEIFKFRPKYS